jgi:hypothetical protein
MGYRYSVGGKDYTGKDSREWEEEKAHALGVGDKVTASVSASHPNASCLGSTGRAWMGLPIFLAILLFELLLFGVLLDGILRALFGIQILADNEQNPLPVLIFIAVFGLIFCLAALVLGRSRMGRPKFYRKSW